MNGQHYNDLSGISIFSRQGATGKIMLAIRSKDDRRSHTRYVVDWNASVTIADHEIFHGRIHDISLGGACFLTEKKIVTAEPLVMLIDTPLPHFRQKEVVTRIECSLRHAVPSSSDSKFHLGINFIHFQGIEKHLLAEALFLRSPLPSRRIH